VAAAIYGAGAFVTPRGVSTAPVQTQQSVSSSPEFLAQSAKAAPLPLPSAEEEAAPSFVKWVSTGVMVGVLAATLSATPAMAAPQADGRMSNPSPVTGASKPPVGLNGVRPEGFSGVAIKNQQVNRDKLGFIKGPRAQDMKNLELCKNSKKFKKIMKDQLFKIGKRQSKFAKGSLPYERLNDKIALTKKRQEAYGGRWCSKFRGLPYTITTGEITRGSIIPPALAFLYTTGWIGWAGRTYLRRTRDMQKEIMIDVPLAASIMLSGYAWPVLAWKDIVDGKFVRPDTEVRTGEWTAWKQAPGYGPIQK